MMLTVVETLLFQKQWPLLDGGRKRQVAAFIASDPDAGVIVEQVARGMRAETRSSRLAKLIEACAVG
jgi:hypothetical protein